MHIDAMFAFAEGLHRRDIPFVMYPLEKEYRPCDVAVTFGIEKRRTGRGRMVGEIIAAHSVATAHYTRELRKKCHLVIERGFIHRDRYFMIGWGGLNGRAKYLNRFSPANRWNQLEVPVAPWRADGEHIVLCGQVPWDASVQHVDHVQWCRETAKTLRQLTSRPIIFRPHPLAKDAVDMQGTGVDVILSQADSLQEDMKNAWAVVTFSSNAGVEATLAGIPSFVCDEGAMGYSLLNKDLRRIESPLKPDRTQWLYDLAYTQWTLEEAAMGAPIAHLWEPQPISRRFKNAVSMLCRGGQGVKLRAA
ncbi:hypothetical protein [Blastopirellula retiformator]|nr:hypothetical protein [Blastopirellula retiformator]